MENPYQAPEADQNSDLPAGSRTDLVIAQVAIWLYRAPVIAVLVTVLFRNSVFSVFAENQAADPERLAVEISRVLWISLLGLGLGLCGWVLALVSLFRPYPRRRPHFWSWMILSSVYAFFGFPIGTVCGLFVIGLVIRNRKQFFVGPVVEVDVSDH